MRFFCWCRVSCFFNILDELILTSMLPGYTPPSSVAHRCWVFIFQSCVVVIVPFVWYYCSVFWSGDCCSSISIVGWSEKVRHMTCTSTRPSRRICSSRLWMIPKYARSSNLIRLINPFSDSSFKNTHFGRGISRILFRHKLHLHFAIRTLDVGSSSEIIWTNWML